MIRRDFEQSGMADITHLTAANQHFSRAELADWDASARAWLGSADRAKALQHTQLRLIMDNVQLPVHRSSSLYTSVMEVWKCSLDQLEGLLNGMPLEARSGDILLALSAWHLFPDMVVLGLEQTLVHQNDSLLPTGALLTVGLQSQESLPQNGIFWSLPLAHFRYYGEPVVRSRSLSTNRQGRIPMEELLQAICCYYIRAWDFSLADTATALQFFLDISEQVLSGLPPGDDYECWFRMLSEAAHRQIRLGSRDANYARNLRNLGRRQGQRFLGGKSAPFPGLLDYEIFSSVARSEEDIVEVFRQLAQSTGLASDDLFIRYRLRHGQEESELGPNSERNHFAYATALPEDIRGIKRTADSIEKARAAHVRWFPRRASTMSISYLT